MNRRLFLTFVASAPLMAKEFSNSQDIYLNHSECLTLVSLKNRLARLQRHVGYANFNLISYSQALFYARNYSSIGAFRKDELDLIDKLFHENQKQYGFFGAKTCKSIENKIDKKDVIKIPRSGHFLFRGKPYEDYKRLKKDIGKTLILTSGVRNVVKQLNLYVRKIYRCHGNITKASISIAPPAYSYHTVSDFDVGRFDWGYKNFTAEFENTKEFQKMRQLDYIGMRYKRNNKDGVRFEPWHVEVI